ncbi:MAG: hypothetical protein ACF8XB_00755, partial [Planctomycetota bacterium JB042]
MRPCLSLPLPLPRLPGLAAGLVAALALPASAQIEHGGEPASAFVDLAPAETVELPPVDVRVHLLEDLRRPKAAFRFGAPVELGLGLENAGTWESLPNGGR